MADQERKRRRPAVSCALCRRRKIRCNRQTPCGNCVRSKSGHCVYGDEPLGTPLRNLAPAQGSRKQVRVLPASESPSVGSDSTTNRSRLASGLQRCKLLAKIIKAQLAPPWPVPPTSDLPPKALADKLLDCYLRTTETIYRILHIPTFKKDYDEVWLTDKTPDTAFLVQLKLVLAIGATTYDEKFSLRASAIRWVHEAQTWLAEPEFKARLSLQVLQTNLLLLVARQTASVGASMIWISAGSLIRNAMYIGLHRDAACLPEGTVFSIEMRRRLWNTILEIALQSSLDSGAPPLISLRSFDTEPPRNFNDNQLMLGNLLPASDDTFTQMSVAIALRKTFPIRLAVTEFLNNFQSASSYEETLQLDGALRKSYKELCRTLQGLNSATGSSPSRFQIQVVDFIMHRYFLALHIPFFVPPLRETAYAFSRNVVVDASLKIWRAVLLPSSHSDEISPLNGDDLERLAICGSQFFRVSALQACFMVAAELIFQLQEENSLSPAPLRPDLLSIVNDAVNWSFRCVEAGETNIKGHLFMCLVDARLDGLIRGVGKDELLASLIRAVENGQENCLRVLEERAAEGQTGARVDLFSQTGIDTPKGMEDWDIMMPIGQFNFDSGDPMNWWFDDETMEHLPL
ncbi:C6 zinc finger domain-containing protein [Histoplasma capsulatum var. duboisii H88]|uniref:C6 zinc finger domain-containing protein n=1 Tax=Ajellomyces capsulatus (strain H88) TaxID=544711 RepID=F0UA28_AJEC8|nr:C6 zinc finger domain-containing protein [Histoplasma capsulatum var. duboisii H88]